MNSLPLRYQFRLSTLLLATATIGLILANLFPRQTTDVTDPQRILTISRRGYPFPYATDVTWTEDAEAGRSQHQGSRNLVALAGNLLVIGLACGSLLWGRLLVTTRDRRLPNRRAKG